MEWNIFSSAFSHEKMAASPRAHFYQRLSSAAPALSFTRYELSLTYYSTVMKFSNKGHVNTNWKLLDEMDDKAIRSRKVITRLHIKSYCILMVLHFILAQTNMYMQSILNFINICNHSSVRMIWLGKSLIISRLKT